MAVSIEFLADHPAAMAQLGRWMHEEWPSEGYSADDRAAVYVTCLQRDRVPLTLVALDGRQPVGTVSLLEHSVASHEHLGPWVAALYVSPGWRRAGLATRLVAAATDAARRLGLPWVYIGVASPARAHYERLGWEHVGIGQVDGDPTDRVDVLQRGLA